MTTIQIPVACRSCGQPVQWDGDGTLLHAEPWPGFLGGPTRDRYAENTMGRGGWFHEGRTGCPYPTPWGSR